MSRKSDLERHIRAANKLIRDYEATLQLSSDPKEQARCSSEIARQRKLIRGYLKEYKPLVRAEGLAVPDDIRQISAAIGISLPGETSPPRAPDLAPEAKVPQPEPVPPVDTPPFTGHALIVGVGDYSNFRELAKATTDARDLRDLLVQNGYRANDCRLLLDAGATKGAISDALEKLARRATADDTVVIFFAGHGMQRIGGFEPGEYLCPIEADRYDLHATAISDAEFTAALKAIRAGRLLVLLDACHAGGVGEPRDAMETMRSGLSEGSYTQMAAGKGRVVIASCRPDEVSWELSGLGNGLFTHCLLEGLRGAAAGPDGAVRVFELFRHVSERVPQFMPQQHPLFKGEMDSDFVVARVAKVA